MALPRSVGQAHPLHSTAPPVKVALDLPLRHAQVVGDVGSVLRILCALNRQWEPDWKWLRERTETFDVAPERLPERIDGIFSSQSAERAVELCLELVLDTLRLIPERPNAAHAITIVEEYIERYAK